MASAMKSQTVRLLVEPIGSLKDNSPATPEHQNGPVKPKLEVPPSHVFLIARPDEWPRLQENQPETMENVAVLEILRKGSAPPRLLLISSEGEQPRVNGGIAPRVSVLHERDQFQINGAFAFHFLLFNNPNIGSPRAESVDHAACPVCTKVFTADSKTIACVHCDQEYHFEGEHGLDCANLITDCASCSQPLIRAASYSSEPAL